MPPTAPASTDSLPHSITLRIPYPTHQDAEVVQKVMTVDRELRPADVNKVWAIESAPQGQPEGSVVLCITIHACDMRSLRVSANALLEDVALVTRSIEAFQPDAMRAARNAGLEMGSVGRAG